MAGLYSDRTSRYGSCKAVLVGTVLNRSMEDGLLTSLDRPALRKAGLWVLLVLQGTMALALFTATQPHPPLTVPLFAMAPFLGASLAIAAAAISLAEAAGRAGAWLALLAALLALVSYGPVKWLDPGIGAIWPAVATGQLAALAVILTSLPALLRARVAVRLESIGSCARRPVALRGPEGSSARRDC